MSLLQAAQQEQPQPAPVEQEQPQAAMGRPIMQGGEEIDDAQVEEFLEIAYRVIYGGDTPGGQLSSPVMSMLRSGPEGGQAADPVQALAETAGSVSAKALAHSYGEGNRLDGAAAYAGMIELIGEIATDAESEGIYDYSQEEIDGAAMRAGEILYNHAKDTGAFPQQEMERDGRDMAMESQSGALDSQLAMMQQSGAM